MRERTQAGLNSAPARGHNRGRPKGLSEHYQLIAPDVREMYEKKQCSTNEIRKIFGIKSQPTLYRILQFAGVAVNGF
ncbi:hypothetical protein LX87_05617 [Larkinella arboricola]|uniref:Helix-turn-helix resolvase-like protein n=1 Tax=Larkinella arboricola TaxID=643671 RepID=A0A327WJB5_LARAB|nr:recombinase family protein [Larkinella arboricola]RAJ89883.1 hypothetical protein LX87_05617 [Larkinella arboricola]